MKALSKLVFLVSLLGLTLHVSADPLVYDNGPLNGTINAWNVTPPFTVSDSFTLGGTTNLTSVQVGLWLRPGDTPSMVDWSIGTTHFASDISSGTSSFSNTFQYTSGFGYDLYESVFNITGTAGAGTFYLTLGNGTSANSNNFFWDENDGLSMAFQNVLGPIGSESFQIYGTSSVPDAGSSVMLLGMSLAGVGYLRRKIRA
jgi:hypothetical protein